jgi:hypothetical protein
MGAVTPKLPSTESLSHTLLELLVEGYDPLFVAFPAQAPAAAVLALAGHTGGNAEPMTTVLGSPE